jgi:hypothetical protein
MTRPWTPVERAWARAMRKVYWQEKDKLEAMVELKREETK